MLCKFYSEWERSNRCWALCVPWSVLCVVLYCLLCEVLQFDSKSLRSNQWGVAPPCQVTCWCPLSATGTLFTSSTSSPICLLNLCSHLILLLPIFTINPFRSQLDNNSLITSSATSCIHKQYYSLSKAPTAQHKYFFFYLFTADMVFHIPVYFQLYFLYTIIIFF